MNPRRIALTVCLLFALAAVAEAKALYVALLNNNDPWIARDVDRAIYKLEWYGGSSLFWKGDIVLLTKGWGFAKMVGIKGLSKGRVAKVWVEKLTAQSDRPLPKKVPEKRRFRP